MVTKASSEVPTGLTAMWWLSLVGEGEADSEELSPPVTPIHPRPSRLSASLHASPVHSLWECGQNACCTIHWVRFASVTPGRVS